MTPFSDRQFRQDVDAVLDAAQRQGEVRIKTGDGRQYGLRLIPTGPSPLDVPGVDTPLSREELLQALREGRQRGPEPDEDATR